MGAPVVVSPLKRNSRISIQSPSSLSPQPSVTEMERRLSVLDDRRTVLEHELADAIAHHGADSVTAASKRAMLDVVNESRRATALELSRLRGEGETVA